MCTLSWTRKKSPEGVSGYTLIFNRDEQRTRPRAVPPNIVANDSRKWIAATDPQGGGTWLASNDAGLTVALLNSYESPPGQQEPPAAPFRSRGLLVRDVVAQCDGVSSVTDWLNEAITEAGYRPFYLAAIDLEEESFRHWDGALLKPLEPDGFLTSSSFEPEKVIPFRAGQYLKSKDQESFHRQYDPDNAASSVVMSRPDAATVSLSKIDVSRGAGINYRYAEGPDWIWQTPVEIPFSQLLLP